RIRLVHHHQLDEQGGHWHVRPFGRACIRDLSDRQRPQRCVSVRRVRPRRVRDCPADQVAQETLKSSGPSHEKRERTMNYRVKNIGIAVALAALAAILTSVYVVNYKRHVQNGEDKVPVYVAAHDIPAGTSGAEVIDQHMLKKVTVPHKAIVAGAISSPDQLSQYIATQDVFEGEQVSTRRFSPPKEQGLRAQIKGTQRAYQVEGDSHQLLAGTLKAGDHVDVVGTWEVKNPSQSGSSSDDAVVSRVVLRDLLVLTAAPADAATT